MPGIMTPPTEKGASTWLHVPVGQQAAGTWIDDVLRVALVRMPEPVAEPVPTAQPVAVEGEGPAAEASKETGMLPH